ncbi:MAG: DUF488 domain-containing protein [Capnocytophaga felis]|nr:DUF488 domain-containing protein [Capnocytophaga felis]
MKKLPLYTIGHGNRKVEEFLAILKNLGIEFLIDVRSQPYSKFNPQFNQNNLAFFLESNGIRYVFMGDSIGGRPKDVTCYDDEGRVDYEVVKTKDFFIQGINRLKMAYDKNVSVVIMCSESKPCECHRSKLIGRALNLENVVVEHIDEKGKLKNQVSVINELNKGLAEFDLFGNPVNSTSRKAYL